jgi:predicted transcriptional regulator
MNRMGEGELQQIGDSTMEYLALFNAIDKHLDKILWEDAFLPFNEKVKRIAHGNYPVSWFVKLHQYQLKYFGELRNHITHGIKQHGHTMAYPSSYAIEKLQRFRDAILQPPKAIDVFAREVYICHDSDLFTDVLAMMHQHGYTHVPVYDQAKHFVGVLTEWLVLQWLAEHVSSNGTVSLDGAIIKELPLKYNNNDYMFVSKNKNIYEIDQVFTFRREEQKRLGAIFITEHGNSSEKILGIVTGGDVALVDRYVIH